MEPIFFDARVVYKVATEAEWNNIVLDTLIKGEFYFYVEEGDPNTVINIKVGDGVRQPKDLPFFWDASIRVPFFGSATPSSTPSPASGDGFWIVSTAGTYTNYGGVELPANSLGIITRVGTTYSILVSTIDLSGYATTEDVEEVDNKIIGLTNSDTLDIKSPTVNGYVTDTGSIVTSTSWVSSVDRPVSEGDIIHYEGVRPNQPATAAVIGKKANGDIVIILDNQPSPDTNIYVGDLSVPVGVTTITASARNLTGDSFILTREYFNVKSDKVEGLEPFKDEILGLTIEAPSGAVDIKGETQARILNADGTLTVSANWSYMPPRSVSEGDIIRYYGIKPYGSTTTGVGMIGRDASNNITVLIPKNPNTNTTPSNEYITIPSGIVSIEACARNITGDQFLVQKVTGFELVVRADKVEGYGKKTLPGFYLAIGDSITAQDGTTQGGQLLRGYQQYIMDVFSFSNGYYNGGFSGHSLSSSPVAGRENDCIVRRLGEYPTNSFHKYVTVLALTNDFRLDCEIGVPDDFLNDTGDTTVYGAFRILVDYIYDQDSHANIIFMTPFQRNNSGYSTFVPNPAGFTLLDYIDAMLWVANRMSIPVINLMQESGINPNNFSYYLRDGLHPNNLGYQVIGNLATQGAIKYFI